MAANQAPIQYQTGLPDQDGIVNLYQVLGWYTYLRLTPQKLLEAMQGSFAIVNAYAAGRLVGTGRIISDGVINAYLCGLGVLPEYRGLGIGTHISQRLVEICEANGLHGQFIAEDQLRAFYAARGFQRFGQGFKVSGDHA